MGFIRVATCDYFDKMTAMLHEIEGIFQTIGVIKDHQVIRNIYISPVVFKGDGTGEWPQPVAQCTD